MPLSLVGATLRFLALGGPSRLQRDGLHHHATPLGSAPAFLPPLRSRDAPAPRRRCELASRLRHWRPAPYPFRRREPLFVGPPAPLRDALAANALVGARRSSQPRHWRHPLEPFRASLPAPPTPPNVKPLQVIDAIRSTRLTNLAVARFACSRRWVAFLFGCRLRPTNGSSCAPRDD